MEGVRTLGAQDCRGRWSECELEKRQEGRAREAQADQTENENREKSPHRVRVSVQVLEQVMKSHHVGGSGTGLEETWQPTQEEDTPRVERAR